MAHETWLRAEKSMQALAKQGLLKDAKTCKLEFCEHCVLRKKIKVKFNTAIYRSKGIRDYVHTDVWDPLRMHLLEENIILSPLLMITLGEIGCTP